MLQTALAGLLFAGVMTSIVVLNEVGSPAQALQRLTPVVVGTLDLESSPASATFAVSNMAPGDVAVRSLTVANGGTLPFRYAMHAAVDADPSGLAAQLRVTLREGTNGGCDDDSGGVIAQRSALTELAFGSREWGAQEGDRRLNPDASEVLCFSVELPLATTSAQSDSTAELTFTFHAEEIRDQ